MKKINLTFNINSLLYNHDNDAIEMLKSQNKYNLIKDYEKPVQNKIVNTIKLEVNDDDTIDYIKKKLSLALFNKIQNKKNQKTCFYCFSDKDIITNKSNDIIISKSNILSGISTKKISEKEEKNEINFLEDNLEEDFDLGDINLDDLSDDESDDESIASINISEILQNGAGKKQKGGSKDEKKIMICHNCKKCYMFDSYFDIDKFENYNDIFPLPELFHLSTEKEILGYNLIDIQRKKIPLMLQDINVTNPFENITLINRKSLTKGKNNKLIIYLKLVLDNDIKYHKYIKNESFLLVKNYEIKNNELNLFYLPEMALYNKSYEIKCLDLYSNIHFPYANFINYYLKFIKKNLNYDYISCTNKKINRIDQYKVEELITGWGDKYETYDKLIDKFEDLKENIDYEQYTNKIFYKINENNDNNILVNFQNIYHLFDLDENIPYMSSYIPEESIILEKIFKGEEKEIIKKSQEWKLYNKNIVHFRVLMPPDILETSEKYYFQVNLYENMKIEVNISVLTSLMKYITVQKLMKINERINHLIERLNNTNIFNFNGLQLPLSNTNFNDWNKENSVTNINSMNFYLKIRSSLKEEQMIKILSNLNRCMGVYFHKDFDFIENNFRYKRINNVSLSDITDRFIYHTYQSIVEEFNLENEKDIKKIILERIQDFFDKKRKEALSIYENYKLRYKSFLIKPLNYGLYFNIKELDEWKDIESKLYNYKVTIMGMRDYNDWEKIKDFILKLFHLIEGLVKDYKDTKEIADLCDIKKIEKEQKVIIKKGTYLAYQEEVYEYKILAREKQENAKKTNNKKERKQLLDERDIILKKISKLEKIIKDKKATMKKTKNVSTYLQRLQNLYPNLKMSCPECGAAPESKECLTCNIPTQQSQYATQCQRNRQPMGTGQGAEPEIIDFNKERELQRFDRLDLLNDKVRNDFQQGGAKEHKKYTAQFYEEWGINNMPDKYPHKMDINSCKNVPKLEKGKQGYNKTALKEIAKHYDIDENLSKKEICDAIYQKVKSTGSDIISQLKETLASNPSDEDTKMLLAYYERPIISFNNLKTDLPNLAKLFKVNINEKHTYKINKDKVLDEVSQIFNGNYKILKNKYKKILKLEPIIKALRKTKFAKEEDYIVKQMIIYNTIKIIPINEWSETHIRKIRQSINGETGISKSKKENIKYILTKIHEFHKQYLQQEKQQKLKETDFKDFADEVGLLYRKDKNNNIVHSTMSYKNKAISCPNFNDNKNNTLVGFLDMDFDNTKNYSDTKLRDMLCQPCCFVAKKDDQGVQILDKRYQRNMRFCKGKISWKNYMKSVEDEEKAENYISTTVSSNKTNTYGKLPELLHDLFNNYSRLYNLRNKTTIQTSLFKDFKTTNLLKNPGFVTKGIKQTRNTILLLASEVLELSVEKIIQKIETKLNGNKMLFNQLNSGKIAIRFETIENYIKYLKTDNVDIRWIIEALSLPDLFNKNGFNYIILTERNQDIQIKQIKDISFEDYYDITKSCIFIYEYESGDIEPIVLKYPGRKNETKIFTTENTKEYEKYFKKEKETIIVLQDFIKFINIWVNSLFQTSILTTKKMIELLEKSKKYNFKTQIIDKFNKAIFIITTNDELVPLIPNRFILEKDIKILTTENILKPFIKSLEDTKEYITKFATEINNEDYEPSKVILNDNGTQIVGLELFNQLMIPVIPENYEKSKGLKSKNKLFFNINNALYSKETPDIDLDFIKEKYDFEVYQRLLLEFSNFIHINEIYKETLIKLINEDTFDNRLKIKESVEEVLDQIVIYKEPELINYRQFVKYEKGKNIRQLCAINNDFLCEKNDGLSKLVIPLNKKNSFIGILIENMITNEQIREKIISNNINRIIDTTNFINDSKHIFIKKDAIF
jgi:hypothetical protein